MAEIPVINVSEVTPSIAKATSPEVLTSLSREVPGDTARFLVIAPSPNSLTNVGASALGALQVSGLKSGKEVILRLIGFGNGSDLEKLLGEIRKPKGGDPVLSADGSKVDVAKMFALLLQVDETCNLVRNPAQIHLGPPQNIPIATVSPASRVPWFVDSKLTLI